MSNSNVEIVDDNDSRVKYSDGWGLGGTSREYDGTTHGTFAAGTQATLIFNGSSVEVYGSIGIDHDPPVSTYSIDGSPPQTFSPPLPNAIQYRLLFYKSPTLDDGQHVLVVTSTIAERAFWLDYFQIASNAILTPIPDPVSPASTSNPSTNFITQSFTASISDSPSQSSSNTSKLSGNKPVIGAIVGGVVGGVIVVLLACLFVLCYRRRTRSHRGSSGSSAHTDGRCEHRAPSKFLTNVHLRSICDIKQSRGRELKVGSCIMILNPGFIGEVSPFTGLQASTNGRSTEKSNRASEPINPWDMANLSNSASAFRKSGRPGGRGESSYDPEAPPQYS